MAKGLRYTNPYLKNLTQKEYEEILIKCVASNDAVETGDYKKALKLLSEFKNKTTSKE